MVVFNTSGSEVNTKIVYYGPALSGKTTNLEHIYRQMPSDVKGKMVSMKTRTDRTLFFDFLPLQLGDVNGYRTRILLYTVPGQVYYNATRKLVLKGADAVVFVADSDPEKHEENIDSLRNLEENLNELGLTLDTTPWVIQFNKRDLPSAAPVRTLESELNLLNVPSYEAIATQGIGVYETFQGIAGMLYNKLTEKLEPRRPEDAAQPAATPEVLAGPPNNDKSMTDVIDDALREVATPVPGSAPVEATAAPVAEASESPAGQVDGEMITAPAQIAAAPAGQPAPITPAPAQAAVTPPAPTSQSVPTDVAPSTAPSAAPVASAPVTETPVALQETARPSADTEHIECEHEDTVMPAPPRVSADSEDETFKFASLEAKKMDETVGPVLDLDEKDNEEKVDTKPLAKEDEFITDPCRSDAVNNEIENITEMISNTEDVTLDEQSAMLDDECTITVPVLLSRTQIRKTIPIKLRLEVQIIDDDL